MLRLIVVVFIAKKSGMTAQTTRARSGSILIKLELVNTVPDQRWASQHTPTPSKLTKYNNLVSTEHSVAVAQKASDAPRAG